jgi:hypothetical protein
MSTSVVIAYKDMGCPHRRASFQFVSAFYEDLGHEVVVEGGDDLFTRAKGINTAIDRASGDIIIQSDPDSIVRPEMLADAIEQATTSDGLVVCHDRYLYLTEQATEAVLSGARDFTAAQPDDCESHGHGGVGNVTVFSRATWAAVGGFDESFGVWGGDDAAFAYATDAFCGPMRRTPGDMVHLWHPRLPQSIPGDPGYAEQFALLEPWRDAAARGRDAVRELVAERRSR